MSILKAGLDIVLNIEVNQKDPAGITTPYRLLVPALWYDGSSDREKLDSAVGVQRKPTLLNRFGMGGRRQHKAAQNQGAGNWGQEMSDTESYAGSEEVQKKQPPRRRFSLFGNRRRKQEEEEDMYTDDESDLDDNTAVRPQFAQPPQAQQPQQFQQAPIQTAPQRHVSAPTSKAVQRAYDTGQFQHQTPPAGPAPAQRMVAAGYQQPQTSKAVQRAYETNQLRSPAMQAAPAHDDVLYDITNRPPSQHLGRQQPQSSAPRRSLTITSQKNRNPAPIRSTSDNYPTQSPPAPQPQQQPYSNQSAYERQNRFNAPPQPQTYSQPQSQQQPSTSMPQRRLSKQERVLGLGGSDDYQPPRPQQQTLRGNGIIGGQDSYSNETSPQGYSGIEAYKEPGKPKRGFSFRKARDWLDGRRDGERERDSGGWDEYEERGQGQSQGQGYRQGQGQGQRVY